MLLDLITCSFGWSWLDQNLDSLTAAMSNMPAQFGSLVGLGRTLGAILALCIGAYEAYQMMLGKRGLDVMKILRIILVSLAITSSQGICEMLRAPGDYLSEHSKQLMMANNQATSELTQQSELKQKEYVDSIGAVLVSVAKAERATEPGSLTEVLGIADLQDQITSYLKQGILSIESWIVTGLCSLIKFIGEMFFQVSYYFLLVGKECFMAILAIFAPVVFALSLAAPFKNAWSQWLSKFVSISLWGFITYIVCYYTDYIVQYALQSDLVAWQQAMGQLASASSSSSPFADGFKLIGCQGLKNCAMYAMAMFLGAMLLKQVPEVASWVIPGGVSSGMGTASGAAASAVGGAVGATTSTVVLGGPNKVAGMAGSYNQARSDGKSAVGAVGTTIASHSGLGRSYSSGADQARGLHNVGRSDSNYTPGGSNS